MFAGSGVATDITQPWSPLLSPDKTNKKACTFPIVCEFCLV